MVSYSYLVVEVHVIGDDFRVIVQTVISLHHFLDDVSDTSGENETGHLVFVQHLEQPVAAVSEYNEKNRQTRKASTTNYYSCDPSEQCIWASKFKNHILGCQIFVCEEFMKMSIWCLCCTLKSQ